MCEWKPYLLPLIVTGCAALASVGYTIPANRFDHFPTTPTPAPSPTPMFPFPSYTYDCILVTPQNTGEHVEIFADKRRVTGSKGTIYLLGKSGQNGFQNLFPGQNLPVDFDFDRNQLWDCGRIF